MKRCFAGVAGLVWLGYLSVAAGAQPLAVEAGVLIDPETGTTRSNQRILVEDGKITRVGTDIPIPSDARVIDLSRSTVLPGLIDAHTHMLLTMDPEGHANYHFTTLVNTTAYRAIEGVANARSMLLHGFTTIRDVGNNANHGDTDLKRAIDAGIVPGPRMVIAGRIIAPFGGQLQLQPERPDLAEPEYFFADTRDELVKAVRENIHYGATLIKIVVDDQKYIYSVDDIRTVIEEAGNAGLKVAAHCVTERGFHNAAEAGVASIEHGFEASDESLELAKKNNVVLVGTDLTELTAKLWEFDEEFRLGVVDRLRRAQRIGVTMAYGTDIFFSWPEESRGDLSLTLLDVYLEAGLSPAYILKMMTTNAAELLGLGGEIAKIEEGFAADIIATPRNPLEDILALREVTFVMKDGKVYKEDGAAPL